MSIIITSCDCEVNHGHEAVKVWRIPQIYVSIDKVVLPTKPRFDIGTELIIRCPNLAGEGNFIGLARVTRVTQEFIEATWRLTWADKMHLELGLQQEEKKVA